MCRCASSSQQHLLPLLQHDLLLSLSPPSPPLPAAAAASASPATLANAASAWSAMTLQLRRHWHSQRKSRSSRAADAPANADDNQHICHRSLQYPLPVYIDSIGAAACAANFFELSVSITLQASLAAVLLGYEDAAAALPPSSAPSSYLEANSTQTFTTTLTRADTTVLNLMKVLNFVQLICDVRLL